MGGKPGMHSQCIGTIVFSKIGPSRLTFHYGDTLRALLSLRFPSETYRLLLRSVASRCNWALGKCAYGLPLCSGGTLQLHLMQWSNRRHWNSSRHMKYFRWSWTLFEHRSKNIKYHQLNYRTSKTAVRKDLSITVNSAESALGNILFPSGPRFHKHCQAEDLDVSATHLVLSRCDLKGLDFVSRLDRTPAGKSDEPAGVIEIFTIDNILK